MQPTDIQTNSPQSETLPNPLFSPRSSYPGVRIGVITADWHRGITYRMRDRCAELLAEHQVEAVESCQTPGSFELGVTAEVMASSRRYDALIVFGCIIKGETRHDSFIAEALLNEIQVISTRHQTPIVCGVLTTENKQQAEARSNGQHSDKGRECALAALQMVDLMRVIKNR